MINTIGNIAVFTLFEIPLIVLSLFIIKKFYSHLQKLFSVSSFNRGLSKEILKLIIYLILFIVIFLHAVFLVIIAFMPDKLSDIPIGVKLFFLFSLLTAYGLFVSLILGLKDAVRAGGSATNIVMTVIGYIKAVLRGKSDRITKTGSGHEN
jgi:hypothetical protein